MEEEQMIQMIEKSAEALNTSTDEFLLRCTCSNCDWKTNDCEWKFDPYNTDGDCLAMK